MPRSNDQIIPPLKRVLVVGNGGRENALAWALQRCTGIENVWVAPGNGGTNEHQGCKRLDVNETDLTGLIEASLSNQVDLIVVGPETPLAEGLSDGLRQAGIAVFGPGADGAQLESSKAWAKKLMKEARIPTSQYWETSSEKEALSILQKIKKPLVVKADGLAAGKGVTVPRTVEETKQAIQTTFDGRFGVAGKQVILEEKLEGPEVSVFALSDGKKLVTLPPAQDHKRLKDGDQGPNTGGMGAYAPAPLLNDKQLAEVQKTILEPVLTALKNRCIDYRGVIYAGLMLTESGPKVIEFNCRFGDPECQTLMPLMGKELAHVLQACALGCLEKAPQLFISSRCSACVIAASSGYPNSPRRGDQITIETQSSPSLQIFHSGTKCNLEGNLFTAGGRVLSVVAQGNDFDEAFNSAYKGLKDINFDGITYRRDIGNQVRKNLVC